GQAERGPRTGAPDRWHSRRGGADRLAADPDAEESSTGVLARHPTTSPSLVSRGGFGRIGAALADDARGLANLAASLGRRPARSAGCGSLLAHAVHLGRSHGLRAHRVG